MNAMTRKRTRKKWNDLSPRTRRIIVACAIVDSALRTAALVDLARHPADRVRGSKKVWAVAIALVSSGGVVPGAYFALGRRRDADR